MRFLWRAHNVSNGGQPDGRVGLERIQFQSEPSDANRYKQRKTIIDF
jgi:hypothetical protein